MSSIGCEATLRRVPSIGDAAATLRGAESDLIVVQRDLPIPDPTPYGELARMASNGQLVQLLGAWCEGEERTGQVIDGFRRVFWHAWPLWWRGWLTKFLGRQRLRQRLCGATVAIAADIDTGHAIGDALAECGACCVPLGASFGERVLVGPPDAVIWNGSQLGGLEAERLRRWTRGWPAPIVALLDFPRPETVVAAREIGVSAVLGKPCDSELLCHAVGDAIEFYRQRIRTRRRDPCAALLEFAAGSRRVA